MTDERWLLLFFVAIQWLSTITTIATIGKPRTPITSSTAILALLVTLLVTGGVYLVGFA